jgi:hypothetical protein
VPPGTLRLVPEKDQNGLTHWPDMVRRHSWLGQTGTPCRLSARPTPTPAGSFVEFPVQAARHGIGHP